MALADGSSSSSPPKSRHDRFAATFGRVGILIFFLIHGRAPPNSCRPLVRLGFLGLLRLLAHGAYGRGVVVEFAWLARRGVARRGGGGRQRRAALAREGLLLGEGRHFCGSRASRWLFLAYGPIALGAGLLGRRRRRFAARARENPAFGSEMLLGCSCSLAARMPARSRIELFWVPMKLLRDCWRSARVFFAVEPRVSSNPAR